MLLGQRLVQSGIVTLENVQMALQQQVVHGGRIGTQLLKKGFIDIDTLSAALARHAGAPAAKLKHFEQVDEKTLALMPGQLAAKHKALPLASITRNGKELLVALRDPHDMAAIDEIAFVAGARIRPFVAPELCVVRYIERYYHIKVELDFPSIQNQPRTRDRRVSRVDVLGPTPSSGPGPGEGTFIPGGHPGAGRPLEGGLLRPLEGATRPLEGAMVRPLEGAMVRPLDPGHPLASGPNAPATLPGQPSPPGGAQGRVPLPRGASSSGRLLPHPTSWLGNDNPSQPQPTPPAPAPATLPAQQTPPSGHAYAMPTGRSLSGIRNLVEILPAAIEPPPTKREESVPLAPAVDFVSWGSEPAPWELPPQERAPEPVRAAGPLPEEIKLDTRSLPTPVASGPWELPGQEKAMHAAAEWLQPIPGQPRPPREGLEQKAIRAAAEWMPKPPSQSPPPREGLEQKAMRAAAEWMPEAQAAERLRADADQKALRTAAEWMPQVHGTPGRPGGGGPSTDLELTNPVLEFLPPDAVHVTTELPAPVPEPPSASASALAAALAQPRPEIPSVPPLGGGLLPLPPLAHPGAPPLPLPMAEGAPPLPLPVAGGPLPSPSASPPLPLPLPLPGAPGLGAGGARSLPLPLPVASGGLPGSGAPPLPQPVAAPAGAPPPLPLPVAAGSPPVPGAGPLPFPPGAAPPLPLPVAARPGGPPLPGPSLPLPGPTPYLPLPGPSLPLPVPAASAAPPMASPAPGGLDAPPGLSPSVPMPADGTAGAPSPAPSAGGAERSPLAAEPSPGAPPAARATAPALPGTPGAAGDAAVTPSLAAPAAPASPSPAALTATGDAAGQPALPQPPAAQSAPAAPGTPVAALAPATTPGPGANEQPSPTPAGAPPAAHAGSLPGPLATPIASLRPLQVQPGPPGGAQRPGGAVPIAPIQFEAGSVRPGGAAAGTPAQPGLTALNPASAPAAEPRPASAPASGEAPAATHPAAVQEESAPPGSAAPAGVAAPTGPDPGEAAATQVPATSPASPPAGPAAATGATPGAATPDVVSADPATTAARSAVGDAARAEVERLVPTASAPAAGESPPGGPTPVAADSAALASGPSAVATAAGLAFGGVFADASEAEPIELPLDALMPIDPEDAQVAQLPVPEPSPPRPAVEPGAPRSAPAGESSGPATAGSPRTGWIDMLPSPADRLPPAPLSGDAGGASGHERASADAGWEPVSLDDDDAPVAGAQGSGEGATAAGEGRRAGTELERDGSSAPTPDAVPEASTAAAPPGGVDAQDARAVAPSTSAGSAEASTVPSANDGAPAAAEPAASAATPAQPAAPTTPSAGAGAPPPAAQAPARPGLSLEDALARIERADSRDAIGEAVIDYLRSTFGVGLVFIVKDEIAFGWLGFGPGLDKAVIAALAVPLSAPSVLSLGYKRAALFRGAPTEANGVMQSHFYKLIKAETPAEVAVAPVLVGKRVINLVYAQSFDGGPLPDAAPPELARLSRSAGEAYVRVIKIQKGTATPQPQ